MKPRSRLHSRFDHDDEDPRAGLVNLVDVMLVFSCGLLAALAAGGQAVLQPPREIVQGREIPAPPRQAMRQGRATRPSARSTATPRPASCY
jgi:hypothetical protein